MCAAGKFRYNAPIFFVHGLVGDEIGKDLSIMANGSGGFIAGRFYGEDQGQCSIFNVE